MINRRRFVQGLSAAALAAKPIAAMTKTLRGNLYPNASWIQEGIERARSGELGDVTHIFVYSESFTDERLKQYAGIAHSIFGEAPLTTFTEEGGSESRYKRAPQAMLCYSNGRRFVYRAISGKTASGDQMWIYGTGGSLNLPLQR